MPSATRLRGRIAVAKATNALKRLTEAEKLNYRDAAFRRDVCHGRSTFYDRSASEAQKRRRGPPRNNREPYAPASSSILHSVGEGERGATGSAGTSFVTGATGVAGAASASAVGASDAAGAAASVVGVASAGGFAGAVTAPPEA